MKIGKKSYQQRNDIRSGLSIRLESKIKGIFYQLHVIYKQVQFIYKEETLSFLFPLLIERER